MHLSFFQSAVQPVNSTVIFLKDMRASIFILLLGAISISTATFAAEQISYVAIPVNHPYPVQHTFDNGDKVKIISIKEYKLSSGDKWLQFRYVTKLDLNNQQLLLNEAKTIWPSFKSMTEAYNHKIAVMAPSHQSGSLLSVKTESKQIPIKLINDIWEFSK